MNINNLAENQIIKNYKELCILVNWEVSSGNTKKSQFKELDRFCTYHKEGNKFIIDEVFDDPKDKIDNRNGNSQYSDYIENLIMHECSLTNLSDKYKYIELSRNGLLLKLNMINNNFTIGRTYINQFSRYLEISIETIFDFYDSTQSKNKSMLEGTLNRLQSQSLISWSEIIKIKTKEGYYKTATPNDIENILECEQEALKQLDMKDKREVYRKYKWSEFSTIVKELLIDTDIDYYFKNYHIITTQLFRNKVLDEAKQIEDKSDLNALIGESASRSAENRHDKTMEMKLGATRVSLKGKVIYWGFDQKKQDVSGNFYYDSDKNRNRDEYVKDTNRIIEICIDDSSKLNLYNELKNIKEDKCTYKSLNEKEEKIDVSRVLDELFGQL